MILSHFLSALLVLSLVILTYYFFLLAVYSLIQFLSLLQLKRRMRVVRAGVRLPEEALTPVSVIVPAFNESATIVQSVASFLAQDYPGVEVIVVNDGSSDDTMLRLQQAFDLIPLQADRAGPLPCQPLLAAYTGRSLPNLIVLDKANGGKSDALNAGLNAAHHPLVCCVDADSLLAPNAVRQLACHFARREDTVAVGGIVRPLNGCTVRNGLVEQVRLPGSALERMQVVEYLRAFLTGRLGWESLGSLLIVSGAFGMFDRNTLLAAGGYNRTVGEDAELTLRLHRFCRQTGRPCRIVLAPDALCWTQAPSRLADLRTQRMRWQRGLAESLYRHRSMLLNPRYGTVGMLALPFAWLAELLGPVVELLGHLLVVLAIVFGVAAPQALMLVAMAYLHGVVQSVLAVAAEDRATRLYTDRGSTAALILACFAEPLFYRPITVLWRCLALFTLWRAPAWGSIRRQAF